MRELKGARALLTGAAGGLGRHIARSLAAEGVDLALTDLPDTPLADAAEDVGKQGVRAEALVADLARGPEVEALVDRVAAGGAIDILVNNAGVEYAGAFTRNTPEELEQITRVNLLAPMLLTRLLLPGMLERGRGHVVNIASMAGKGAFPYLGSYCATKHGLVGFTHSLRAEYGGEPVGFSAICPGIISGVGMYGRVESEVPDVPWMLGKLPPERVGEAVVRAIRRNLPEVIVNRRPGARPLALLNAVAPGAAVRVVRRRRFMELAQRFVRARGRL
jgi:short-subunit dehydrogenase